MDGNIVPIVGILCVFGLPCIIAITKIRADAAAKNNGNIEELSDHFEDLLDSRMEKVESRIGNLETIVLETEKHREFDKL